MSTHLHNIKQAFTEVFAHTSYIALASVLTLFAFVFAVWFPNLGLIIDVFTTSSAPIVAKLKLIMSLLGGIGTNFSVLSAGYTIAIAILFGILVAMIVYLIRKRQAQLGGGTLATGLGGVFSGILGVGCAACGSFLLMTILASFGATGAIALLPLKGGEFGVVSVGLLVISLAITARKITEPLTCES
ncbi:MAG: hypothetical protein COU90_01735 [Candidatus Ryanbacteria bacterium CG10_big_fil_rev_8_21_14_0_10_43_42]|uniref:Uncharacterized protein n=1 Tax=Candidatus Ryanbacteria bacterium CG10_big_fil_rev_8_21_14_0_10_43_42 TaxID=1974864 RepID=A0A2M8KXC3_9BACT|nr:MAG: hypothetical protein COU90_01735 [Candidatus Ryanbacteria bacterium CG10_big_fil_rev_8_21_14_0_10_43_42]